MPKRKEKIFRAGALLVKVMQRLFYLLVGLATACAIGSNYADPVWRAPLVSAAWYLFGFATAWFAIFVLAYWITGGEFSELTNTTTAPASN